MGRGEVRGHIRSGSYVERHSRSVGKSGAVSATRNTGAERAARAASLSAADEAAVSDPAAARDEIKGQCSQLVHEVLLAGVDVPWPPKDNREHVKTLALEARSMRLYYLGRTADVNTNDLNTRTSECSELLHTRHRADDAEHTSTDIGVLVDFVDEYWDEIWERAAKQLCEAYTSTIDELQAYFAARFVDEGKVRVGPNGRHEITDPAAARSMIESLSELSEGEDDAMVRADIEWPAQPITPENITMPPVPYDGIISDDIIIRDLVTRIVDDYDSEWFAGVVQEAAERFGAGRMEADRDGWFVQQRAREHWRAQGGIPFDDLLAIEPDAGPVNYRDICYGIEHALAMRASEMVNEAP